MKSENQAKQDSGLSSRSLNCYVVPKLYKTILADPPWEQTTGKTGYSKTRPNRPQQLPYPTMTVEEIKALPIGSFADVGCHLWLWTINQYLEAGFDVMRAWGFKYLAPITAVKPSGCGNHFVHTTQTILFGYKEKCLFPLGKYKRTDFKMGLPKRHSQKPQESYDYIEQISIEPRLEIFARPYSPLFPKRSGWDVWGNEVVSDIEIAT